MSAIKHLDYEYNIGDSIDIINSNFKEISQYITTANSYLSSSSYVLEDFLNNKFQSLKEIANIVAENQYNWDQVYTLVSTNSARWLQPLVFLYPCIFKDNTANFTTAIKNEVIDWMNTQFPVTSITGEVNYVENQKAYIGITYQTSSLITDAFMNNIRTLVLSVEGCRWAFHQSVAGSIINPTPTPSITRTLAITKSPAITLPVPTPANTSANNNTPTVEYEYKSTLLDYYNQTSIVGEHSATAKNNIIVNSLYMKGYNFAIIGAGTSYNNCRAGSNKTLITSTIEGVTQTTTVGGNRGVVGHKYHLFINVNSDLYYYAPTAAECDILYSVLSQTPPLLTATDKTGSRSTANINKNVSKTGTLPNSLNNNSQIKNLTNISKYKIIKSANIECITTSSRSGACYGGMSGYVSEIKFLGNESFTPKPTPTPSPRPRSFYLTLIQLGSDSYSNVSTEHTGLIQLSLKHITDSYFFISLKHKTLPEQKYNLYADNDMSVGVNNLHYGLYDVDITCFNPNYPPARSKMTGELYIPQTSGLPYLKISGVGVKNNIPIIS